VFLDERHAQAVMGGAQGGDVAAGAGADDGEVISRITHARNLAVANPQANKRISTMQELMENGVRIIDFRWRRF
jgi:hypothetical protein